MGLGCAQMAHTRCKAAAMLSGKRAHVLGVLSWVGCESRVWTGVHGSGVPLVRCLIRGS